MQQSDGQEQRIQVLEDRLALSQRREQRNYDDAQYWQLRYFEMYKAVRESDKGVRRLRRKLDRIIDGQREGVGDSSEDSRSRNVASGG